MKVVLFCAGQGMRLRDHSDQIPKPRVPVGQRPILWHLMKDYARYGHKEFILCLGRGALQIKEFFLNLNECESNDFVLADGGQDVRMVATDNDDWKITFVDTGLRGSPGRSRHRTPSTSSTATTTARSNGSSTSPARRSRSKPGSSPSDARSST